jgi:hypothetical protein
MVTARSIYHMNNVNSRQVCVCVCVCVCVYVCVCRGLERNTRHLITFTNQHSLALPTLYQVTWPEFRDAVIQQTLGDPKADPKQLQVQKLKTQQKIFATFKCSKET